MSSISTGTITYGLPKLRDDQNSVNVSGRPEKSPQESGVFSYADRADPTSQIATSPYIEIALNTEGVSNVASSSAAGIEEVSSIITEVRYMKAVRMVEEEILSNNSGKWPSDLTADEFGRYVDSAKISDPAIKEKIEARFTDYETNNVADPEDTSSRYSEYSAHGKWVMVYNSYRDVFLGLDVKSSVSFDNLFAKLQALNARLSSPYVLPQDPASLDERDLAKHVAGLLMSGIGSGEKCVSLEMLMIAEVMANRYRKGARMVEESILSDNNNKWPDDLTAAKFGRYVDSAKISDQVIREKNKARFVDYETNDKVDPEDTNSKYSEYGAHGKWVMVYNSYRDTFLAIDAMLAEVEGQLGPDAASSCTGAITATRESELPWDQLKAIWADYIARVYASMGAPLSDDGRTALDNLLERGHVDPSGNSTGITAYDVMMLTKAVERERLEGKELRDFNYDDNALQIHTDPVYVPDGLTSRGVGNASVFYKMDGEGIKLKGIRPPLGIRVPGQR